MNFRRLRLCFQRNRSALSPTTKKQAQCFMNGLIIQIALPVVFFVPAMSYSIYSVHAESYLLITEFLFTVINSIPTFFDPIITLFSVAPYRRNITTQKAVGLVCHGIARMLDPRTCFHSNGIILSLHTAITLSIGHTVYFKSRTLSNSSNEFSVRKIAVQTVISMLPVLVLKIISFITPVNFAKVYAQLKADNLTYDIAPDLMTGYADIDQLPPTLYGSITNVIAIGTPIYCLYERRYSAGIMLRADPI
ncbi:unnamed protein product [Caenorhabditis auriculariae]|uniref:Uncharacterized protein n=1 Tax=Caenorhabditis auriculariae TaxID=2777116 RepID=A0A8S1HB66_9PELO|nr:unnamed protein product [Caenorhabditis auriculariae]